MDRRRFLKFTSMGSLGMTTDQWWSKNVDDAIPLQHIGGGGEKLIDPVVPINFFINRKDEMIRQISELRNKYGLKKFLVCEPMDGSRLSGFPQLETYRRIGEKILEVKQALEHTDIKIGWWCAPSISSGFDERFQNITDISGAVAEFSPCPLDTVFREEFSDNIAMVVSIAKPFMIQFEDDFELSRQAPSVNFGCFCPLHMSEFSKRQGRTFTRQDLYELFKNSNADTIQLRRNWGELSRDTLSDFAKLIRKKVDKVAPQTRISLCQADMSDFDGDFTEAVARAFAGKTKPITRLYGSSYHSDDPLTLPASIFHALYSKQHLPTDIECLHESDTYPHTRFFMSAAKLRSFMAVAFSYGFDDSLLYATQYLDNMLEEKGYLEMFKDEVKWFSKIKEVVNGSSVTGCEIMHDPWAHTAVPYKPSYSGWGKRPSAPSNPWISVLGRFGIPYTSKNGKVKIVTGECLKLMNDEEIKGLLRSAVLMDGYAAYILSKRGFGKLIGAEVLPGDKADFIYEGIANVEEYTNIKGKLMYNFVYTPADKDDASFYVLSPVVNAEIITNFLDAEENVVTPGLIRFENESGGRIAITAHNLRENQYSSIFNYKKKEIIRKTIEWLGSEELPVFVKNHPNVFCICNKNNDNGNLIVTVVNLSSDSIKNGLTFDVPVGRKNSSVSLLQSDGSWRPLTVKRSGRRTMELNIILQVMNPVIIKLEN